MGTFYQAGKLKMHIEGVHEKKKNHKCQTCQKTFYLAGKLKRHIEAVHKKIKNHQCETCPRAFFEARDLKKHVESVHEKKIIYNCETSQNDLSAYTDFFISTEHTKKEIEHKPVLNKIKKLECETCHKIFYDYVN